MNAFRSKPMMKEQRESMFQFDLQLANVTRILKSTASVHGSLSGVVAEYHC